MRTAPPNAIAVTAAKLALLRRDCSANPASADAAACAAAGFPVAANAHETKSAMRSRNRDGSPKKLQADLHRRAASATTSPQAVLKVIESRLRPRRSGPPGHPDSASSPARAPRRPSAGARAMPRRILKKNEDDYELDAFPMGNTAAATEETRIRARSPATLCRTLLSFATLQDLAKRAAMHAAQPINDWPAACRQDIGKRK